MQCSKSYEPQYVFSVKGDKTLLNGNEILLKGVRLSDSLISDRAVEELISNLESFDYCGLNSIIVHLQGSSFRDIKGFVVLAG